MGSVFAPLKFTLAAEYSEGSPGSEAGITPPAYFVGSCAAAVKVVPYPGAFRLNRRTLWRDCEPTYATSSTVCRP